MVSLTKHYSHFKIKPCFWWEAPHGYVFTLISSLTMVIPGDIETEIRYAESLLFSYPRSVHLTAQDWISQVREYPLTLISRPLLLMKKHPPPPYLTLRSQNIVTKERLLISGKPTAAPYPRQPEGAIFEPMFVYTCPNCIISSEPSFLLFLSETTTSCH